MLFPDHVACRRQPSPSYFQTCSTPSWSKRGRSCKLSTPPILTQATVPSWLNKSYKLRSRRQLVTEAGRWVHYCYSFLPLESCTQVRPEWASNSLHRTKLVGLSMPDTYSKASRHCSSWTSTLVHLQWRCCWKRAWTIPVERILHFPSGQWCFEKTYCWGTMLRIDRSRIGWSNRQDQR